MFFVRFISEVKSLFKINMGFAGEAEIACSKKEDPITTGNTYMVTEYDKINLISNLLSKTDEISVEVLDTKRLRDSIKGFPQFRNNYLPLVKDDLKCSDDKSQFNILIIDGLGINATDISLRESAWLSVYRKLMSDKDIVVRFSVSSSITFSNFAPVASASRFTDSVLFGPVPLHRIMDFDYVINSPLLGSLDYARKNDYCEQVNNFVDPAWSATKLYQPRFAPDMDNEDLFVDSIIRMGVDSSKKTILVNALSDMSLSTPKSSVMADIAKHIKESMDVNVIVCGISDDLGDGIINITGRVKSFQMLNAIIKRADGVVSCDGPAIPMCVDGQTPSVLLCSLIKPEVVSQMSKHVKAVEVFDVSRIDNLNKPTEAEKGLLSEGWEAIDINGVVKLLAGALK